MNSILALALFFSAGCAFATNPKASVMVFDSNFQTQSLEVSGAQVYTNQELRSELPAPKKIDALISSAGLDEATKSFDRMAKDMFFLDSTSLTEDELARRYPGIESVRLNSFRSKASELKSQRSN
ncbi:MAG: hypothetical protein ACXVBE_11920 [Bdellovibrionota bacterium]